MTVADFFNKLGAPLRNSRWSWGAVRTSDGAVVLRVWQDRKFVENHKPHMMLTHHGKYDENDPDNLGHKERLEHVELIRGGAKCIMVMCRAVNPEALPRKIASFNAEDVFIGGRLVQKKEDEFIEVIERVPVSSLIVTQRE